MTTDSKINVIISGNADKLGQAAKKGEKSLSTLGKAAKSVGSMLAGAFAIKEVIQFGVESSKLAAKQEGIKRAFDRLGVSLESLRKATRGTASDFKLMQSTVQAKNLGLNVKELGTFFEFAQKRAEQTGESVEYLVNSIVLGIGRKSPLILDNLGINAIKMRERFQEMGDFGAAASSIINEELENMGDVAETTSTKMQQLGASWENFSVAVGDAINQGGAGGIPGFFADMLDGMGLLIKTGNVWNGILGGQAGFIKALQDEAVGYVKEQEKIASIQSTVNAAFASGNLEAYVSALGQNIYKSEILAEIKKRQLELLTAEAKAEQENTAAIEENNKALEAQYKALSKVRKEQAALTESLMTGQFDKKPTDITGGTLSGAKGISQNQSGQDGFTAMLEKRMEGLSRYVQKTKEVLNAREAMFSQDTENTFEWSDLGEKAFQGMANVVSDALSNTENIFQAFGEFFKNFIKGIIIKLATATLAAIVLVAALNMIPGLGAGSSFMGIEKGVGLGKNIMAGITNFGGFASGGLTPGGMTLVGERGPELVNLPGQSRVYSSGQSKGMMNGGVTVNFNGIVGNPAAVARQIEQLMKNNSSTTTRTSSF